ncbi:hypothetical protein TRFO_17207 [Tritrichomonas foetus]|uniref:Uncharacterized protein n=1 Tax=Tritrichomonas foetus TaxID=1144522 RepID=A0A1J4KNF3_9EUKA|nr:hypothetical protein TRFO_17207 [Tritrichomonas foetus]|eukprot:OHT12839.1 hypothetical protein TRFO_17207 [Tritrichomonas foetus]
MLAIFLSLFNMFDINQLLPFQQHSKKLIYSNEDAPEYNLKIITNRINLGDILVDQTVLVTYCLFQHIHVASTEGAGLYLTGETLNFNITDTTFYDVKALDHECNGGGFYFKGLKLLMHRIVGVECSARNGAIWFSYPYEYYELNFSCGYNCECLSNTILSNMNYLMYGTYLNVSYCETVLNTPAFFLFTDTEDSLFSFFTVANTYGSSTMICECYNCEYFNIINNTATKGEVEGYTYMYGCISVQNPGDPLKFRNFVFQDNTYTYFVYFYFDRVLRLTDCTIDSGLTYSIRLESGSIELDGVTRLGKGPTNEFEFIYGIEDRFMPTNAFTFNYEGGFYNLKRTIVKIYLFSYILSE